MLCDSLSFFLSSLIRCRDIRYNCCSGGCGFPGKVYTHETAFSTRHHLLHHRCLLDILPSLDQHCHHLYGSRQALNLHTHTHSYFTNLTHTHTGFIALYVFYVVVVIVGRLVYQRWRSAGQTSEVSQVRM